MISDFECKEHGVHELLLDSPEQAKCPVCGGPVERVWTDGSGGCHFEFKSRGFYATEYGTGTQRLH
jgi:predicted nucleic acid-binding Zn ribbon protein